MKRLRSVAWLLAAPTLAAAASAAPLQASFQPGDLYLITSDWVNGFLFTNPGVLRVDPFSGSVNLVLPLLTIGHGATYDPVRGGIVFWGQLVPSPSPFGLITLKADGSTTIVLPAMGQPGCLAGTQDGRLYFTENGSTLRYVDAQNVAHDVLDAAGAAAFTFQNENFGPDQMFYDSGTHSLFLAARTMNGCALPAFFRTLMVRVPLTPDGTQVGGPVQSAVVCMPNATTEYIAASLGEGPGGSLFLTVDDNSNDQHFRMMTVDKTTLAATPYAANGFYVGAAFAPTGLYSKLMGRGMILDPFSNQLRLYGSGEAGQGTSWAGGSILSGNGAGNAFLLEIPPSAASHLVPYGAGTPGCNGPLVLGATSAPSVGAANFRFTCSNAPSGALGLLLVGNVPDLAGTDLFGLGFLFHVDLIASTFLDGLDLNSNAIGVGLSPAPIPITPSLVGQTVDAQAIWAFSGCAAPSPFGLASSNGLAVTFQ